jgi:hypothetical protein
VLLRLGELLLHPSRVLFFLVQVRELVLRFLKLTMPSQ